MKTVAIVSQLGMAVWSSVSLSFRIIERSGVSVLCLTPIQNIDSLSMLLWKEFAPQGLNVFHRNKSCHRDRIARLTAPCPSHKKNFNVKLFANADANAGGSTIALPGLRPGELKRKLEKLFSLVKDK